ncbi:hypothetical protein OG896_25005 [Streptomyces sp. NBC_00669]|uniref:hypothetical protein n=1 Tax=Streptomyces sp. NBC_00669 TaxID=2976011 RepID=UPI002E303073|nr:hypothetical protein [Streptomyces sp. NBC_00669]
MSAQPTQAPGGDLIDKDGHVWRCAVETRDGNALYYLDGTSGCPSWVMSTQAELEDLFGAKMRPFTGGEGR